VDAGKTDYRAFDKAFSTAGMTRDRLRRGIYLAATAAVCLGGLGSLGTAFVSFGGMRGMPNGFWILAVIPILMALATFAALIWVFLFLARRPRAWGKLVCLVGLPWIQFSAIGWWLGTAREGFPFTPLMVLPGAAGALLLCLGGVLLVVDRGAVLSYRPTSD
jgi:hypothetical protein